MKEARPMKFRIHFETSRYGQMYEDSIVIAGESVEEIRTKAESELAERGGQNPWSEQL